MWLQWNRIETNTRSKTVQKICTIYVINLVTLYLSIVQFHFDCHWIAPNVIIIKYRYRCIYLSSKIIRQCIWIQYVIAFTCVNPMFLLRKPECWKNYRVHIDWNIQQQKNDNNISTNEKLTTQRNICRKNLFRPITDLSIRWMSMWCSCMPVYMDVVIC